MKNNKCMCEVPTVINISHESVVYCQCGGYIEASKFKAREVEPFDISKHEFSDDFTYFDFDLHRDRGVIIIDGEVDRDDIIAIARYLKIKPEELK